jgi:hypothetical protein
MPWSQREFYDVALVLLEWSSLQRRRLVRSSPSACSASFLAWANVADSPRHTWVMEPGSPKISQPTIPGYPFVAGKL